MRAAVVLVVCGTAACMAPRVTLSPTVSALDHAMQTLEQQTRTWPRPADDDHAARLARVRRDLVALTILAGHLDRRPHRHADDLAEAQALAARLARDLPRLAAGVPRRAATGDFHAALADAASAVHDLTRDLAHAEATRRRIWIDRLLPWNWTW